MTTSNGMPRTTAAAIADRPRSLLVGLAEGARRILGAQERRAPGGLSRSRSAAPQPAEIAVPLSAFKMVGLAEVQAKLGDRWPALAEKVHLIAQNTISRHLARGDVFERQGDDGYLVLFATLGSAEAEFKSRVIAKEIVQHLLGEGEADGIGLRALCTEISATALAKGDHEAVLAEALARAAPAHETPSANRLGPATADDAQARSRLSPAGPDAARGGAGRAQGPADGEVQEAPEVRVHVYSPVWDVTQMTLLRFRAFVLEEPTAGPPNRALEWEAFQADLALIRAVGEDLRELADNGRRLPITLALRHTSLSSGSQRMRIYQALAELPAPLHKLMTLEICLSSDEFWTYACRAFLEMTRPLGVGWSALIDLERPQAIPQGGSWLRGVGGALADEARGEAESMRLLSSFGARARALRLECAAYGLSSRALVLGAVGAGFRFLAGPAIHVDVQRPAMAVRFEPLDLYPDLARSVPTGAPRH